MTNLEAPNQHSELIENARVISSGFDPKEIGAAIVNISRMLDISPEETAKILAAEYGLTGLSPASEETSFILPDIVTRFEQLFPEQGTIQDEIYPSPALMLWRIVASGTSNDQAFKFISEIVKNYQTFPRLYRRLVEYTTWQSCPEEFKRIADIMLKGSAAEKKIEKINFSNWIRALFGPKNT